MLYILIDLFIHSALNRIERVYEHEARDDRDGRHSPHAGSPVLRILFNVPKHVNGINGAEHCVSAGCV